jgi:hypothetical protein
MHRTCSTHGKRLNAYTIFLGNPEGKRQLGRLRHKQKKVKLSLYRPWRPLGLREVEATTFSDICLTDCGKVVSFTRRPPFTPRKIPGTHFC